MIVLGIEVVVLCVLHIGSIVELSPVDEMMHFDNLVRTSRPDLVPDSAAQLEQETLRELACRAEHDDAWSVAPAGSTCLVTTHHADAFWWRGLNPSIGHVPLYYLLTGVAARFLRMLVPAFGLLTSARLLGIVWALTGCYLTLRAAKVMGNGRLLSTACLGLVLAVPSQLTAMTMVNPDAALFAVGAAILLVVVKIVDGTVSAWWFVPASVLTMLVDPSASIALLFGAAYLAIEALRIRKASGSPIAQTAMVVTVAVAASIMTLTGWAALVAGTSEVGDFIGSPQDGLYRVDHLPVASVVGDRPLLALLPPTDQPHEAAPLRTPTRAVFIAFARLLLVVGAVGSVLRESGRTTSLAAAALTALMTAAPLMILRNYLVNHWYFEIPSRYGISALPVLALLLAGAVTGRIGRGVVAGVAVGVVAATVVALA